MTAKTDVSQAFYGKPGEGRVVRDPAHAFRIVPGEPHYYPRNSFWVRRFACGDMVECVPGAPTSQPAVKPATKAAPRAASAD